MPVSRNTTSNLEQSTIKCLWMQVLSCWFQPQAPPLKANEFLHRTSSKSAEVQAKPSPILQAKSISVTPLWFCGKSLALSVKLISGIGRRIFSRCSRISCEKRTHAEFHMWPNYSARLYKLRFPHSWLNQSALLIALFPFVLFPGCHAISLSYQSSHLLWLFGGHNSNLQHSSPELFYTIQNAFNLHSFFCIANEIQSCFG